jgi:hypothetical protein
VYVYAVFAPADAVLLQELQWCSCDIIILRIAAACIVLQAHKRLVLFHVAVVHISMCSAVLVNSTRELRRMLLHSGRMD